MAALGLGGFAAVLVLETNLDRIVTVTLLIPYLQNGARANLEHRYRRQLARLVVDLSHPNLVAKQPQCHRCQPLSDASAIYLTTGRGGSPEGNCYYAHQPAIVQTCLPQVVSQFRGAGCQPAANATTSNGRLAICPPRNWQTQTLPCRVFVSLPIVSVLVLGLGGAGAGLGLTGGLGLASSSPGIGKASTGTGGW